MEEERETRARSVLAQDIGNSGGMNACVSIQTMSVGHHQVFVDRPNAEL